jgi:hypothetical protein
MDSNHQFGLPYHAVTIHSDQTCGHGVSQICNRLMPGPASSLGINKRSWTELARTQIRFYTHRGLTNLKRCPLAYHSAVRKQPLHGGYCKPDT